MARRKKEVEEYVEVEGIKCKVKNPARKAITQFYQDNLRDAISDYERSVSRWMESKKNYRDNLKVNVIIAPFVLGWLHRPEDPDEYLLIKGYITDEEFKKRKRKESASKKTTRKPAAPKKPVAKGSAKSTNGVNKEPAAKPKPVAKKPTAAKEAPAKPSKPKVSDKTVAAKPAAKNGATKVTKPAAKGSQRAQAKSPETKKAAPKKAAPKRTPKK